MSHIVEAVAQSAFPSLMYVSVPPNPPPPPTVCQQRSCEFLISGIKTHNKLAACLEGLFLRGVRADRDCYESKRAPFKSQRTGAGRAGPGRAGPGRTNARSDRLVCKRGGTSFISTLFEMGRDLLQIKLLWCLLHQTKSFTSPIRVIIQTRLGRILALFFSTEFNCEFTQNYRQRRQVFH